jgi:copper chaperone
MHQFHIPGMTCGGCLGVVTRAVQKLDPQAHIEGNLESRTIAVKSSKAEETLRTALQDAGYPAQPGPIKS